MVEVKNDGGPAFPQHDLSGYGIGPKMDGDRYLVGGMSLRDRFAIEAMSSAVFESYADQTGSYLDVAMRAYEFADAMLIARAALSKASPNLPSASQEGGE